PPAKPGAYLTELFTPDPRNRYHQRYCGEAACRRASKAASQRRWQRKAENRDYFRDPLHVRRVQAWRASHPRYWRRPGPVSAAPLQDRIDTQALVLIGLIANLTGSALQEARQS
ncbi:MAG: hypothetical protein R3221_11810, partial [Spongiibacter sp.]|nr:hypothetical protein [Spongiibacter sp.]